MENKCKKECKTYKKWIKGINTSLSPFAVKYFEFDCINDDDKRGCLFETKGKKVMEMTKEQRETFKKMYKYYKITPPYVWSEEPFEKKKARLMSGNTGDGSLC